MLFLLLNLMAMSAAEDSLHFQKKPLTARIPLVSSLYFRPGGSIGTQSSATPQIFIAFNYTEAATSCVSGLPVR